MQEIPFSDCHVDDSLLEDSASHYTNLMIIHHLLTNAAISKVAVAKEVEATVVMPGAVVAVEVEAEEVSLTPKEPTHLLHLKSQ
jgi:hypothetical protein